MRCPPQLHQNHISWIDIPLKHAQEEANIPYWLGSNVQSAFQTYCTTIVAHETLVRLPKAGRVCCQCESEHGAVSIEAENTWAKNTASSFNRFMCHRLLRFWPQPRNRHALAHCSPAASRCIHHDHDTWRYQAQGNSLAEEIWVAPQPQSFDATAGDRDAQTVRGPHRPRDLRFSHNCSRRMCSKPKCHTAEADAMRPSSLWNSFKRTELPSLKWRREDKIAAERYWKRRARISTESKHTPICVIDWLWTKMLFCMLTHSPRDSKWRSSVSIWLSSVSRDGAKASQSAR